MMDIQVAGHRGPLQIIVKDQFIYKPDKKGSESSFYERAQHTALSPFMAGYHGSEETDKGYGAMRYCKLDNLLHGYVHPCILDLKVCTRSWHDDCTAEKKEFQKAVDRRTTTAEYGLRPCGMKLYQKECDHYVAYGEPLRDKITSYEVLKKLIKVFIQQHGTISEDAVVEITPPKCTVEELQQLQKNFENDTPDDREVFDVLIRKLSVKLTELQKAYASAGFEIISSSLLFFFDCDNPVDTIDVKMIDFTHWKASKTEEGDGYLVGLTSLVRILSDLLRE